MWPEPVITPELLVVMGTRVAHAIVPAGRSAGMATSRQRLLAWLRCAKAVVALCSTVPVELAAKLLTAPVLVFPPKGLSMTRVRLLLGTIVFGCVVTTFGIPAVPATATTVANGVPTSSCNDSWKSAASGAWSVAANWTTGVPGGTSDVCITVPGTYTVTLAPWSVGTADPNHNGDGVGSLTLGEASGTGTQTLDIAGQGSTSNSNEQLSTVFLRRCRCQRHHCPRPPRS